MNCKFLKRVAIAFFICICIGFSISVYATKRDDVKNINNSIVRFHIRANSNSELDQDIKMAARKHFFDIYSLNDKKTKEEVIRFFNENKEEIEKEINTFLKKQNAGYKCSVSVAKEMFPLKKYNDFILPSGMYDSIIIKLGKAQGENFFCVMYPSCCMLDGLTYSTDEKVKQFDGILTEEEVDLIWHTEEKTVIKLKIIELFNKFL